MELRPVNTKYSKVTRIVAVSPKLKRAALLDNLYEEFMEDPYKYASMPEAISDLSGKFRLNIAEIKYLQDRSKKEGKSIDQLRKNR